jgi:hypothetical protein
MNQHRCTLGYVFIRILETVTTASERNNNNNNNSTVRIYLHAGLAAQRTVSTLNTSKEKEAKHKNKIQKQTSLYNFSSSSSIITVNSSIYAN